MFDAQSPIQSGCFGIFPSDLVLRSALIEGIKDLRAKPWLLRYCFNYLLLDPVTRGSYGQAEVNQAIQWFLTHNIPVFLSVRTDDVKMPAISISLVNSTEAEETLADIHAEPVEDSNIDWPNLCGPFAAESYDQNTGNVIIPNGAAEGIVLSPGQILVDRNGNENEILEVIDFTEFQIATNQNIDLSVAYIRGQRPAYQTALESKVFKETYQIGCFVAAEAVHLVYLHSIVVFILMMYKQSLLEARNFERTSISSSDFIRNPAFGEENVFSRHITLTGFVRQMWPKNISPKFTAINSQIKIVNGGDMFSDAESPSQLWIGDEDSYGDGSLPPDTEASSQAASTAAGAAAPLLYFGVATQPGVINEAFVKSLPYSIPQLTKAGLYTYNAGLNEYCWFAYPDSYGGTMFDFKDQSTGFPFGGDFVGTTNVTDLYGITRLYRIYRSDWPNLGLVYMEVD